ncbi:uncharacterized protein F4807DRAFT_411559 [Annulohypoxylon truncatum]|uniref:uncharacterized protein n=1 Tax=Annulohypoxylon truncatum TaxID=327061 RepID=UPI0020078683|nr:uncharacterized protein F4807DRAFT_411559 [Annulohypoxylon truncatum]KAI1213540.1 hypothetical protein F4807DRAFT_411559 [Annulohypoxylon truncatum]
MSLDSILNFNEQVVDDLQGHILPEAAPMSAHDYIREFVPNAAPNPILNYDPDHILEDIPDHSLDPLLDFLRGDIPDAAPDHVRDFTPDQASGDICVPFPAQSPELFLHHGLENIAEDALVPTPEPSPITVSVPQHLIPEPSSFVSTSPSIQFPEDVLMAGSTPASEHILEASLEPAPNPELASTPRSTMDAVPVLVLVPVRNNRRVKKRSGKYRLIKLGGGYAYRLPRR